MRSLAPLVALAFVSLLSVPAVEAQHILSFRALGTAVSGTTVLTACVAWESRNTEPVIYGNWRIALTAPLGGTTTAAFAGQITQQGLDNDPIPEMFVRHGTSLTAGQDLDLTGAIVNWEQPPTLWAHAYHGTYNGYTLDVVVAETGGRFLC